MLTVNRPINLHCTHTKSQTQTLIATLTVNGPLGVIRVGQIATTVSMDGTLGISTVIQLFHMIVTETFPTDIWGVLNFIPAQIYLSVDQKLLKVTFLTLYFSSGVKTLPLEYN